MNRKPLRLRPHSANSPGDFYVEDGCCTACAVPLSEAPGIFDWAPPPDQTHCIVARQPVTQTETDRTLGAMWYAELDCIRYRGNDLSISRRIVEMGSGGQCDMPPPEDAAPLIRSHVTFKTIIGATPVNAKQIVEGFIHNFKAQFDLKYYDPRAEYLEIAKDRVITQISWCEQMYHTIMFKGLADNCWLAVTKPAPDFLRAGRGLSRIVERWLRSSDSFEHMCWFSAEQWKAGGPWCANVI